MQALGRDPIFLETKERGQRIPERDRRDQRRMPSARDWAKDTGRLCVGNHAVGDRPDF
jgi:hypothetical protein